MTLKVYLDKVSISGLSNVIPLSNNTGVAALNEWRAFGAQTLDTFEPAVVALRWNGTSVDVGDFVRTGHSRSPQGLLGGKVIMSHNGADAAVQQPMVSTYVANNEGTITRRDYAGWATVPTNWQSQWPFFTPSGDLIVFVQATQFQRAAFAGDTYRVAVDGTLTYVSTHEHPGFIFYGVSQESEVVSPAPNIVYWPWVISAAGGTGTGAYTSWGAQYVDLNDPFTPHACSPVVTQLETFGLPFWARNPTGGNTFSAADVSEYRWGDTSAMVPGGRGFVVLQEDGVAAYSWDGADMTFHSMLTQIRPSPQKQSPNATPEIHPDGTMSGRGYFANPDGSGFGIEYWYPYENPQWSVLINLDSQITDPIKGEVMGLSQNLTKFFADQWTFAMVDRYENDVLSAEFWWLTDQVPIPTISPLLSAELKDLGQRFISTGLVGP